LPLGASDFQVSDDQYLFLVDCPEMLTLIGDYILANKKNLADARRDGFLKKLDKESEADKKKAEKKAEKKQRQKQKQKEKAGKSSCLRRFAYPLVS
jgi:hypothetical protein